MDYKFTFDLEMESDIKHGRIIQERVDGFRILIVPDTKFQASTTETLGWNFRNRIREAVRLHIDVVDNIPLSANEKFRAGQELLCTCKLI